MTRSDLIKALAERFPHLVTKDAEISVTVITDAIGNALAQGHRVEIRGFGSFTLNYRPAHIGSNPKTGEEIQVPPKYTPRFKAGKEMRARVDRSATPVPLRRVA